MKAQTYIQSAMKIVGLVLLMASVTACQKDKGSLRLETRSGTAGRGATGGMAGQSSGITLKGIIYSDAAYQEQFQDNVRGLLSTDIPDDYVGYVSCRAEHNTGVFFGGRVRLTSGNIRNMTGGESQIDPNSELLIAVYDYFPNAGKLPPIPPLYFKKATGRVSGNRAYIRFEDAYGYIEMEGYFDANRFRGAIAYDNHVKHDGSRPGAAGVLGDFDIGTCDFFRCQ
jgi:hypothetical protein